MKRSTGSLGSFGSGMGLSSRSKSLETLALRNIAEVEGMLLTELTAILDEVTAPTFFESL
jgi:hypothetical protein